MDRNIRLAHMPIPNATMVAFTGLASMYLLNACARLFELRQELLARGLHTVAQAFFDLSHAPVHTFYPLVSGFCRLINES